MHKVDLPASSRKLDAGNACAASSGPESAGPRATAIGNAAAVEGGDSWVAENMESKPTAVGVEDVEGSATSGERSAPSDNMCPICLAAEMEDRSLLDRCFHAFCFECALRWAQVTRKEPTCPLCKAPFSAIIHHIRSETIFDRYEINSLPPPPAKERFGWGSHSLRQQQQQQPRGGTSPRTRRHVPDGVEFRRSVYADDQWARADPRIATRGGRLRLSQLRRDPRRIRRLLPWLRRELRVLVGEEHLGFVSQYLESLLERVDFSDQERVEPMLRPFLFDHTPHFLHELHLFAESPLEMATYDRQTEYDSPRHRRGSVTVPLTAVGRSTRDRESTVTSAPTRVGSEGVEMGHRSDPSAMSLGHEPRGSQERDGERTPAAIRDRPVEDASLGGYRSRWAGVTGDSTRGEEEAAFAPRNGDGGQPTGQQGDSRQLGRAQDAQRAGSVAVDKRKREHEVHMLRAAREALRRRRLHQLAPNLPPPRTCAEPMPSPTTTSTEGVRGEEPDRDPCPREARGAPGRNAMLRRHRQPFDGVAEIPTPGAMTDAELEAELQEVSGQMAADQRALLRAVLLRESTARR